MNLIEAVKSGKRFRRSNYSWIEFDPSIDQALGFRAGDVLADDWEVEEPSKAFTESQLREVFEDTFRTFGGYIIVDSLIKKLGF